MKIHDIELIVYWVVVILSIGISICWVVFSAINHCPDEGGRGGAIGVAISFFALFASRSYGDLFLEHYNGELQKIRNGFANETYGTESELRSLRTRIDALDGKLKLDKLGQKRQSLFLSVSSIGSTIFWGFGDKFAGYVERFLYPI